jgi:lipopolysaccharide biosynthesis glycosyltransferase
MNEMRHTNIALVAVTDNHYVVLLGVLIKSIEKNHETQSPLTYFVVDDGITASNKAKVEACLLHASSQINWISIDDAIPDSQDLPFDRTSYPKNIYTRIFIPDFIPPAYSKVIYLDVDMLMLSDVEDLWSVDISHYLHAAVMDPRVKSFDNSWGGVLNYKELQFAPETMYFNSGLIVFNLDKFREGNYGQKILQCIIDNEKYAQYPDQYGFNVVTADQWLPLDSRWNSFADNYIEKPFLIHFIGRKPIYKTYSFSREYREIFFDYLKETPWADFKIIGEGKRYYKKAFNILGKIPLFIKKKLGL